MPHVIDRQEWAGLAMNDLPDATDLRLDQSGIADRLMGGMCTRPGIGMRQFGSQAGFNNTFGATEGLSKVGTARGNFERHGGGGYASQVKFPEFGGDRYTQVAVINYVPPAAAMGNFIRMSGPGNGYSHLITINADGTLSVSCNGVAGLIVTTAILATGINVIIFTNDRVGGSQKLYINNAEVGSATNTAYGGFGQNFNAVGENTAGNTSVGLFYGFARIINRAQVELLSFDPTLIFEPEESYVYFSAAGGAVIGSTVSRVSLIGVSAGQKISIAQTTGEVRARGSATSTKIAAGNTTGQLRPGASVVSSKIIPASSVGLIALRGSVVGTQISAGVVVGTTISRVGLVGISAGQKIAIAQTAGSIHARGSAISSKRATGSSTGRLHGLASVFSSKITTASSVGRLSLRGYVLGSPVGGTQIIDHRWLVRPRARDYSTRPKQRIYIGTT